MARNGDRTAFGRLVKQYQRRVYAAALHLLGNHSDADDATQETFVRAYRALDNFDGRSEFFTWLYRIAVNTSLNFMRSGRRAGRLGQHGGAEAAHLGGRPEALGMAPRDPEQHHELSREMRRVVEAVASLSPPLRVTLVLSVVQELSHRQVAEILEIPEGTVGWRINEARRLLRRRLAAAEQGPDEISGQAAGDAPDASARARGKRSREERGQRRPAGDPT
ncbi:MAG: sigma-70 family RNA polymerase sigma factor [Myxococcales bacterium]|nr:sigma-70 family RNA polymerase sigma factor [Myxococcales bacterium]